MKNKTFYITTAIDYVNSRPHVGHAFEKVLADAIARWHRLKGEDVFFLTGVDENAQKNVEAAEKAGRVIAFENHPEAGYYYRSDHFNFAKAFGFNPLLVFAIPYGLTAIVFQSQTVKERFPKTRKMLFGQSALLIILAVILLFFIFRNI